MRLTKIIKKVALWIGVVIAIPIVLVIAMELLSFVVPTFTNATISKIVALFFPLEELDENMEAIAPIIERTNAEDYMRVIAMCDSMQEAKPQYEIDYNYYRGYAYSSMDKQKAAEFYYKKNLEKYDGNVVYLGSYLESASNLALLLNVKDDYEESIKIVTKALDVLEQYDDNPINLICFSIMTPARLNTIMADNLVALGKTQDAEKKYQDAINSYLKIKDFLKTSYEAKEDSDYYSLVIHTDINAARAYTSAKQYDMAQQWLKKAKQDISQSEQYTDYINNYKDVILFDIYLTEAQILINQDKPEEAEKAYKECLKLKAANRNHNILKRAQYLTKAMRYQEVIDLFHQLDSFIINRGTTMNIENISKILLPQYSAYRGMGNTPQALMMADSITSILDSAIINTRNDNAAELATIYETQKKESQIAEQSAELSQMRLLWIIGILVAAIIIFGGYSIIRRRNEKRLAEIRAAQERIESELSIARNIQMSMVPNVFPQREGLDMYATMSPAKEVGGDLYGYYFENDKLYFAVGDVSGKGVPASLFMAQATRLFLTLAKQGMTPAEICTHMNDALSGEDNESGMFVTFFLGLIDLSTGHLDFCNAGHNPPVIGGANGGDFLEMKANAPIGLFPGIEYEGEEINSIKGRPLFIYTDGLNEAENTVQEQFGDDHLLDILRHTHFDSAQQTIEKMKVEVEQHRNGAEPNDDLTMMCIHLE